jgi:hypothetical protein
LSTLVTPLLAHCFALARRLEGDMGNALDLGLL